MNTRLRSAEGQLKVPESDPATPLGPGGRRDQIQAPLPQKRKHLSGLASPNPEPRAKCGRFSDAQDVSGFSGPYPSKKSNRPLDRPDRPSALP